MFKKKKPPVDDYEIRLNQMREVIKDYQDKGVVVTYKEIGDCLGIDESIVKQIVGYRFKELTKGAYKDIYNTGDADPDFYLFGNNIVEISNNYFYNAFKKVIEKRRNILFKTMNLKYRGFN